MSLPDKFKTVMRERLGSESDAFFSALDGEPPVSVRFNPFKLSEKPEGRQIPWSKYGFMLDERPVFTLDPLFHAGAYYVQEASSMFIEHIVRSTCCDETMRVLDLCAAPGGKTTLLSTLAGLDGLVVANEVIRQRSQVLADNVRKWGLGNVVVTNNDPEHFAGYKDFFDVVVVDAPCSGEGMFRKDHAVREEWSENSVALSAARQRRILSQIWGSLKPGGVLVYSTCTFNTQENEQNVEWLTANYECDLVEIDVDATWGVVKGNVSGIETFRFYPHKVQGEGFFAAVLRKGDRKIRTATPKPRKQLITDLTRKESVPVGEWVVQPEFMRFARVGDNIYGYYAEQYHVVKLLAETLTVVYSGVLMGQVYGSKLKPEHPLALFHDLARGIVPEVELELDAVLNYLRKKDVDVSAMEEGMNLVTFGGFPVGWIKRIRTRANNLYPKDLRIVNL